MKRFPPTQDIYPLAPNAAYSELTTRFLQLDALIERVIGVLMPDLNQAIIVGHAFAGRNNLLPPAEFTASRSIQVPARDSKSYFYSICCNLSLHLPYPRNRYYKPIAKGEGKKDNTTVYFTAEFAQTSEGKRLIKLCRMLLNLDTAIREVSRMIMTRRA